MVEIALKGMDRDQDRIVHLSEVFGVARSECIRRLKHFSRALSTITSILQICNHCSDQVACNCAVGDYSQEKIISPLCLCNYATSFKNAVTFLIMERRKQD